MGDCDTLKQVDAKIDRAKELLQANIMLGNERAAMLCEESLRRLVRRRVDMLQGELPLGLLQIGGGR